MALLNPPDIVPQVAFLIYRYLLHAPGNEEDEDTLTRLLAPASLSGTPGGQPGTNGLQDTLTGCRVIGLFQHEQKQWRLNPELPSTALNRRAGEGAFRRTLCTLILDPACNGDIWESLEGARDLTRALSWFLMQDPYEAPGRWADEGGVRGVSTVQGLQIRDGQVFSNDTRWGSFTRWAPYLGFACHHSIRGVRTLVPDPTPAIRRTIPLAFSESAELDLPTFIAALSDHLPVLDNGQYRRQLAGRVNPRVLVLPEEEAISATLAHALLSLNEEGIVRIENRDDALTKVRFMGQSSEESVFSHIVKRGGR